MEMFSRAAATITPRSRNNASRSASRSPSGRAVKQAPPPDNERAPVATNDQLKTLEDLERELKDGKQNPDQAVDKAARALKEMAQQAQRRAEKERAEYQAEKDRLAKLAKTATPAESALTRAIRSGDLAAASEAAKSS